MNVFIPRSPQFPIYPEVEQSIKDCNCDPVNILAGLSYTAVKNDYNACVQNVCDLKNICLATMSGLLSWINPCAAICDADEKVVCLDSFALAETLLINNAQYSVVALSDYELPNESIIHNGKIRGCCWVFHKRFFDLKINYQHNQNTPEDHWLTNKIRELGSDIRYLDKTKRLEHLKGK